jgi:ABC-type multidrug transport system ATPase subunit
MVHELAGDGMLILWSTSYLDEAEQCRDVLLMNEGELLYQGEPTTLTQSMAGRSFLLHSPQESNRKLLQRVLKLPQVSDGMIQGRSVRVILKKNLRRTIFVRRRECRRLRLKRQPRVLKMRLSTCSAARGHQNLHWGRFCTPLRAHQAKR